MKQSFLAVTALLFVCAFALLVLGVQTLKESRLTAPTFCERKTERIFEMPDLKRLLPHIKH
ncbi:MAG: hypothetical protein E7357_07485 [Clostridiales bacterium]|nr:hypothetical protein [Clostridiales bacterium]